MYPTGDMTKKQKSDKRSTLITDSSQQIILYGAKFRSNRSSSGIVKKQKKTCVTPFQAKWFIPRIRLYM